MKTAIKSGKNKIALMAACLASLMFGLEISSVPIILPTLERVLHGSFNDLQWIMNAYTIACTTVLMASGALADKYGRKRVFVISVVLFALTSLICGISQSVSVLIVSRFLQGMSGGSMLICQVAILSYQFQEAKERSKAFAVWGIIFGIGLGFGPIIGGVIVAMINWEWVFLIHVPLSIITLFLAYLGITESRDPNAKKLDIGGIVSLSVSVFALIYYIVKGADTGFLSTEGISIVAVAVISFIIFIFIEKRSAHPMFDFSVFGIRSFSGAIMGSIGMNFSFWPLMIYLPIYFQSGLGYDVVETGLSLLAYTLPTLLVPPLAERLMMRYRPGVVIPAGLLTIGLGFFLMKWGSSTDGADWLTMLPGCLLSGVGLGLTNTPVTNTSTGSVSSDRAGMVSGIDMSARLITLAINIALMGFILVNTIFMDLTGSLQKVLTADQLHTIAQNIGSGNFRTTIQNYPELVSVDSLEVIFHAALVQGFGSLMVYGGFGVWLLALASFIIFERKKAID